MNLENRDDGAVDDAERRRPETAIGWNIYSVNELADELVKLTNSQPHNFSRQDVIDLYNIHNKIAFVLADLDPRGIYEPDDEDLSEVYGEAAE